MCQRQKLYSIIALYSYIFAYKQHIKKHYMGKSTESLVHYTYRSCSVMETHAMKLPERSFYADLNGRGGLKLCSD